MPKGKKFDAAEKHFASKQLKLNQEIKSLKFRNSELIKQITALEKANAELNVNLQNINTKLNKLLSLANLSPEELTKICQRDDSMQALLDTIVGIKDFIKI